jgi:hypothetical protein
MFERRDDFERKRTGDSVAEADGPRRRRPQTGVGWTRYWDLIGAPASREASVLVSSGRETDDWDARREIGRIGDACRRPDSALNRRPNRDLALVRADPRRS